MKNSEKLKKILVISGPNISFLGADETSIDEQIFLKEIHSTLNSIGSEFNVEVVCVQFDQEKETIDCLQKATDAFRGIIINAGILARNGYALRNAIEALAVPCVEVFVSNVHASEECRHQSVIASACVGVIGGFGIKSYILALQALVHLREV
ncbi:type II 3-dehydroquinate dehydratase [Candidatus Persebacteraceae bacterium Df01]|jgi:3-dehydroquinate dehydratase-2|uniref:3-dehydroquinate dehydratase n=1 Tax=Candidatus Doriopsillibacter californiensis TaxID=2970740 RepID=A0ABT7QK23_9GAMM|nr:type II 3-dehydroquinate dehydratase [Candidatus Persebacteraceae bacterium Df01]